MNIKFIHLLLLLISHNSFAWDTQELSLPGSHNSLSDALTQGKFKGLLRYSGQYRNSNLHLLQDSSSGDTSNEKKQQYSALGGYLGYETAPWYYASAGATLYTSQAVGNNPGDRSGLGGLDDSKGQQKAYTVWGEAYIKFVHAGHLLKAGRQEMPDYRFVSLSNVRMAPITHEGIVYENTILPSFKLNFAYIARMKERNAEEFIDMARGSRLQVSSNGKNLIRGQYDAADYDANGYIGDKKEMMMAGLVYDFQHLLLEGWNYYINDFVNTSYLYGHYNLFADNDFMKVDLSAQYGRQVDVGEHIAGNIDTWFYGLKLQAEYDNLSYFISFNEVAYNEKSYDGGSIFVRWGTPQMFNSFQVQDSELAGTQSYGTGVQYRFSHHSPLSGVVLRLRYADYDMPDNLAQKDARQDRTETTFDINYGFAKSAALGSIPLQGLSFQFRLAYNDYKTDYDFAEYQRIHGYSLDSVNKDFYDARLYVDYKF